MNLLKKLYVIIGYNAFAAFQRKHKGLIRLLNLGMDLPQEKQPVLSVEDEKDRFQFQLYHCLLDKVEIKSKKVLEVGCGIGGGCYYMNKYFDPLEVTGIDLLDAHIKLAREYYTSTNIKFIKGDACNFTFPTATFDVVIDLESSHAYVDFEKYVKTVYDILKPGGYYTFGDIRINNRIADTYRIFQKCGFEILSKEDVTPAVINSLDQDEERKLKILRHFWHGDTLFKSFSFLKGSRNYNALKSGKWTFIQVVLRK